MYSIGQHFCQPWSYVFLHAHWVNDFCQPRLGFMWAGLQPWNVWLSSVQEDIPHLQEAGEHSDQWHALRFFFLLRHSSHPYFQKFGKVNVVLMRVCRTPSETRPPPACNSLDSNNQTVTDIRCKDFRCMEQITCTEHDCSWTVACVWSCVHYYNLF